MHIAILLLLIISSTVGIANLIVALALCGFVAKIVRSAHSAITAPSKTC